MHLRRTSNDPETFVTAPTPRDVLPVGALVASALMAANYPGDSGEDVDRFIAELEKRGVRLVTDADDDEILRSAEMRWRALEAVRALVGDHVVHKPRRDDCAVCRFFLADARLAEAER